MGMHTYHWPGRVHVGAGASKLAGAQARAVSGAHAFLIADPGVLAAGLVEPVAASLAGAGVACTLYDRVEPNPSTESVDAAAMAYRGSGADLIVGVGGGSALDTAKALRQAAAGPAEASIWEYAYLHGEAGRPAPPLCQAPPLIVAPTTAGTGAEATPWAVLTNTERHLKYGVGADHLFPTVALLDPDLTRTLPRWLAAATGIDALSHLIEAYVSTHNNPALDPLILRGVALVGRSLRTAVTGAEPGAGADGQQARQDMLEAAMLGGIAISSNWLGACHSLAHQLSSYANLHHGVAIAITLPAQMAFSLSAAPERYAHIAKALTGGESAGPGDAILAVKQLIADVGLPVCLFDAGVDESLIPVMAASAYTNDLNWTTNPRPAVQADLEAMYRQAYPRPDDQQSVSSGQ